MTLAIVVFMTQQVKACDAPIHVVYNNKEVEFKDGYPIIYKDRTFLGLRATGNMLGLNVSWDAENRIAWVYNNDNSNIIRVHMTTGDVYINDELQTLSAPPMIIDGRVFVPLRFVAEAFNKTVSYVPSTQIVHINDTNMQQQLF